MRWSVVAGLALALAGCRDLIGIDDPMLAADAPATDAAIDASLCGTADFDSDGVADLCDACPMIAGAQGDADIDDDGIGDACDPDNNTPNTRLFWTGFASPDDIAGWTASAGSWEVNPGEGLVQSASDATGRIALPGMYGPVWMMTAATVHGFGQSAPYFGLCANVSDVGYRCCDLYTDGKLIAATPDQQGESPIVGTVLAGQPITMTMVGQTTKFGCRVAADAGEATTPVLDDAGAQGQLIFHEREVAVAYRYLFVVTAPP